MIELLCRDDLDHLDVRTLLLMHEMEKEKILYTRDELADLLQTSVRSVARRISKFKDLGLVRSVQKTHRVWKYHVILPGTNLPKREMMPYPDEKVCHPGGTPELKELCHNSGMPSHIVYLEQYREKKTYSNKDNSYAVSREENMGVSGPEGKLADVISSSLERTEHARKIKKEKRQANLEMEGDLRQLYETPDARRTRRHGEKTVEQYNVEDLKIVFNEALKEAGFKGRPWKWIGKEEKGMRAMLNQQDPKDVVEYVKYCVQNWARISRRYRLVGPPTIAAIYGYRKSWFTEFLNGESDVLENNRMAEFDDTAEKIPSGSWGY